MKLANMLVGGVPTPVYVHADGTHYDLPRLLTLPGTGVEPPKSLMEAAANAEKLTVSAANAVKLMEMNGNAGEAVVAESSPFLAPVPRPARVLCIGRNYAKHAEERGKAVEGEPIVFLKSSQCVIAHGAAVHLPDGIGQVDFEGELLVVIGVGGKNIAESDALKHVAGYTVFNDITARTMQNKAQSGNLPWFLSKSLDTFAPMGSYLVTPDELPDPHNLRITTTVNGETVQDDTTASMVFPVPVLIAYLSRFFALEPGDVIATGTPSGIGAIVPGDTVSVTIEGIGTLTNPVEGA